LGIVTANLALSLDGFTACNRHWARSGKEGDHGEWPGSEQPRSKRLWSPDARLMPNDLRQGDIARHSLPAVPRCHDADHR